MQGAGAGGGTISGEWRQGWKVVLSAALGTGMAALQAITLGSMVQPLQAEMGWGRGDITAGLAIGSIGTITLTPLVGRIVDRIGARRFVLIGIWFYAAGLAGLGLAGSSIASWYTMWAILAVICMGVSPVAWTIAVASRFDKGRGFALAVTLAGLNAMAATAPFAAIWLIETVGWRLTYAAFGLGCVVVIWPLAYFFFYDAKDLAKKQAAAPQPLDSPVKHAVPVAALTGYTFGQALRSRVSWQILLCLMLVGGGVSAINIHFQAILTDGGISRAQAALIMGTVGPISLLSRLGTGALLDRFPAPFVAAPMLALPIISCLLLRGYDGDYTVALLCAVLNGLTIGAEIDLIAFLVARYCGMRQFGLLYGITFSAFTIGYGGMPLVAGRWFDAMGNYDGILLIVAGFLAISSLLAATLGKYPDFAREAPAA